MRLCLIAAAENIVKQKIMRQGMRGCRITNRNTNRDTNRNTNRISGRIAAALHAVSHGTRLLKAARHYSSKLSRVCS